MDDRDDAPAELALAVCEAIVYSLLVTDAVDAEDLRVALESARDSCADARPEAAADIRRQIDEIVRRTYVA